MSRSPTRRRHHHLNRETIARAALELMDREGVEGFSMRKLAAALQTGVASLYYLGTDKEGIVRDVVALLLSEIDLSDRPGLDWEELAVSIGSSIREVAIRHPLSFPLVALARYDEWPLIEHSRRVDRLFLSAGLPVGLQPNLRVALDAYVTGYLLLATQVQTHTVAESEFPFAETYVEMHLAGEVTNTPQQYEHGIRMIVAGFKQTDGTRGVSLSKRHVGN